MNQQTSVQVPAILTSVSYSKDGGVRLGFSTQELSDEEKLTISKYHQQFGYLLFKPNPFNTEDIPAESAEDRTKTPSKRLRAVLFLLWKQSKSTTDFDTYYKNQIEKMIEVIKEKLD